MKQVARIRPIASTASRRFSRATTNGAAKASNGNGVWVSTSHPKYRDALSGTTDNPNKMPELAVAGAKRTAVQPVVQPQDQQSKRNRRDHKPRDIPNP